MPIAIPINEMTFEEKLTAIELLWDDLCKTPDRLASPEWHGDVLKERELNFKTGNGSFSDWELAKDQIRKKTK